MKLSQKSCKACFGLEKKLEENEINEFLKKINNWQLNQEKNWLFKEFKFKNFIKTLEFVNKISEIAENENHHPNFEFTYGFCKILIQTHKVNGLCESDFILASKIDEL